MYLTDLDQHETLEGTADKAMCLTFVGSSGGKMAG